MPQIQRPNSPRDSLFRRSPSGLRLAVAPIQAVPPPPAEVVEDARGKQEEGGFSRISVPPLAAGGWDAGFQEPATAPAIPPIAEPMQLQEPMQLGMARGSVTFLSAQVDPNGSAAAAEAVVRNEIRGDNIVRGIFRQPSRVHG